MKRGLPASGARSVVVMARLGRDGSVLVGALAAALTCSCDRAVDDAASPAPTPTNATATEPPAPAAVPPPVVDEPPPRGFAVVRSGAELFAKADASASIGALPNRTITKSSDAAFVAPPASGFVVTVVGAHGDFIAVESLSDGGHHCAEPITRWSRLRVGLFVRKSDLVQVTTRKVEHAFADGTRVIVEPGAAIGDATGAGERIVDGGHIGLELPVPADAIGTYYEPIAHSRVRTDERVGTGTLAYGQGRLLGPQDRLERDRDGVVVFERKPAEDGRTLVRVGSDCAEVWALADASAVARPAARAVGLYALTGVADDGGLYGSMLAGATGPSERTYEIRSGAALTWPDGRPAGLVEREVSTTIAPRIDGARSCLVVPFEWGTDAGPELCAATSDVKTIEADPEAGLGLGLAPALGLAKDPASALGTAGASGTPSTPTPARGSLDKTVIRRVVQRHTNMVKHCYEKALVAKPSLAGTVTVAFVIGSDGKVSSAEIKSSTIADATVEGCIVTAVKRWTFPKPVGGGVVNVSYPFTFVPA